MLKWKLSSGILAVITLFGANLFAENPVTLRVKGKRESFMADRAAAFNYPALPDEVNDKILGRKTARTTEVFEYDSHLPHEWGLVNIGMFEAFTPLVQPAKSYISPCSSEIIVAVVDTGIDYTHKKLRQNIWVNPGESGAWNPPGKKGQIAQGGCRDKSCNGIDDDGNGFVDDVVGWDFVHDIPLPYDTHGHGTHIAGIISSEAATGEGTTGVCPKVTIMPLKYYDNSGIGYNNLTNTVRAIRYATKMGANIINYSGGGAEPAVSERLAIEEAEKKGILFVAAAGNDGHDNDQIPYYPENYPLTNIIGVASINKNNQLLPSSNFGKSVQVGAPGLGILSTLPEGKYGTMSGTSQATAFVTGAAALLASQLRAMNQPFDYREIKRWIVESARPLKGNENKTVLSAGLLSVSRALQLQHDELAKKTQPPSQVAVRPNGQARAE